jgi:predicted glycosyltransferase
MNRAQQDEIRETVNGNPSVTVRDFVPDLRGYLASADVVVSMCGYNTAAEIVAQGARAIVVPRTWRYGEHEKGNAAGVEGEQRMRAESLSRLGLVDYLDPDDLSAENLAQRIATVRRDGTEPIAPPLDLDGIANVTDHLVQLATQQKEMKGDAA